MKFNLEKMKEVCNKPTHDFCKLSGFTTHSRIYRNDTEHYYFKDNRANILAVGHLDSVRKPEHFFANQKMVFSPVLDDRLGVFVLLDVLPKLGIKYDILLTDNEECGASTAMNFETTKKYNWIFEFDRSLDDVVLYNYTDDLIKKRLAKVGFKVGWGSYSDIVELEHLGVIGINFGVGYQDYHSISASANLDMLRDQIYKFQKFYKLYKDTKMPYVPDSSKYSSYNRFNEYKCWGDDYDWETKHYGKLNSYDYDFDDADDEDSTEMCIICNSYPAEPGKEGCCDYCYKSMYS